MKLSPRSTLLISVLGVAAVCTVLISFLWETGFTCDDDLFTATAWVKWGGGETGWPAILRASWEMASRQGRFYQLFIYTLAQGAYSFDSIAAANVFRIASVGFVFLAFALMMRELLHGWGPSLFFAIFAMALLQAGYDYNPFHALPLWFNIGAGFLFLAVMYFHRGLSRASWRLHAAAAAMYLLALLTYEVFLGYIALFLAMAWVALKDPSGSGLRRVLKTTAFILAVTGLYLSCHVAFSAAYPSEYTGTSLSPGSPLLVLGAIFKFSTSGLNLGPVLHPAFAWNYRAAVIAAAAFAVSAAGLKLYSATIPSRVLVRLVFGGALTMFLPNVLYGFAERYRLWAATYNSYYLGSFYSAFAEAALLGACALLAVKHCRSATAKAAATYLVAAALGVGAYGNALETDRFFAPHRANREHWALIERLLDERGGVLRGSSAIIIAPSLMRLPPLSPAIYDYWSYYFTGKVGAPVKVVSTREEFLRLPEKERSASSVFGLVTKHSPEVKAGFAALGAIDLEAWKRQPGSLPAGRVAVIFTGNIDGKRLFVPPGDAELRSAHSIPAARTPLAFSGPIDLSQLALER